MPHPFDLRSKVNVVSRPLVDFFDVLSVPGRAWARADGGDVSYFGSVSVVGAA